MDGFPQGSAAAGSQVVREGSNRRASSDPRPGASSPGPPPPQHEAVVNPSGPRVPPLVLTPPEQRFDRRPEREAPEPPPTMTGEEADSLRHEALVDPGAHRIDRVLDSRETDISDAFRRAIQDERRKTHQAGDLEVARVSLPCSLLAGVGKGAWFDIARLHHTDYADAAWKARRGNLPGSWAWFDLEISWFSSTPVLRHVGDVDFVGYIGTLSHTRVVEHIPHVVIKWLLERRTSCVPAKFPPVAVILNQRDRAVLESPLGELHFGREVALDSPRRLRELSMRAEHGDPGRWGLESQRKHEWRRRYHQFFPWHLVDIFRIRAPLRKDWLVALPPWWFDDFEVPGAFPGVLPPALTYLEGRLMTNSPDAWCELRTSWVARVIGRWVTDIILRRIMWRLTSPPDGM